MDKKSRGLKGCDPKLRGGHFATAPVAPSAAGTVRHPFRNGDAAYF